MDFLDLDFSISAIFSDIAVSVLFITTLYFVIGLVFKYFGGRTISQYSPLDFITLLIFAGLVENSIMFAVHYTSFLTMMFSAVYIIMFNSFISRTAFYKKLFPIKRVQLIKNGKIIQENLDKTNLSIDYLWIELRKAGVINLIQVKESFLEPTSAISVLQITDSHIDPVTGLSFHWSSAKDWVSKLFKSGSISLSVVAIDFKNTGDMNDKYGKLKVNNALKEAADIIDSSIRYDDRCFRFVEDRFMIVINSGKENIQKVVQNIEMKLSIIETIESYSFDIYVSNVDHEDEFEGQINILNEYIEEYKDEESDCFIKTRYTYDIDTIKESNIHDVRNIDASEDYKKLD